jgi:hypothetical protein
VAAPLLACLILSLACGKSSTGPKTNPGGAAFSAKIDGTQWSSAFAQAAGGSDGVFSLVGSDASGTAMSLTLQRVGATGTYPLGVGGVVPGGIATISASSKAWSTPLSGAAGSVTVTAISATHITGTFQYEATPFLAGSPGNRAVTNGTFDLPVSPAASLTVADHLWSKFGGTVGGSPWNAATIVMVTHPSSGVLTVGASNTVYFINMIISGFTGAGTYTLNTGVARYLTVNTVATPTQSWGNSNAKSSGTVVVTTYSQTRVKGTFDVVLQPSIGAGGPLALSGTFDVGLPVP